MQTLSLLIFCYLLGFLYETRFGQHNNFWSSDFYSIIEQFILNIYTDPLLRVPHLHSIHVYKKEDLYLSKMHCLNSYAKDTLLLADQLQVLIIISGKHCLCTGLSSTAFDFYGTERNQVLYHCKNNDMWRKRLQIVMYKEAGESKQN